MLKLAKHETALPFAGLSAKANKADTFEDFPTSLMSVGRTADDGTISIFTKDGVTVHKEEDVLIACKGEPILIGVRRDEHRHYRVPLMQQKQKGQWQPRAPKKRVVAALQQANSVYDLPSIEQAIKWMHAVCHMDQGRQSWQLCWLAPPWEDNNNNALNINLTILNINKLDTVE